MDKILISGLLQEALKKATGEAAILVTADNAIKELINLEKERDSFLKAISIKDLAISNLEIKVKDAELQLNSSLELIDEQAAELEKSKLSNPNYRPSLKVKDAEFRINHAVRDAKGTIVSITELAANPKLVAELHKSGSTAVTLLPKENS